MSHVSTAPRAARGGFDALPRPSHSSDSDGDEFGVRARQYRDLSEECEERFRSVSPNSDYEGRGYDAQPHDIHHHAAPGAGQPTRGSVDASRTSSYSDVTKFHAQGAAHRGFYSPAAEKHAMGSPPDQRRPNYKPSALRWPFLTILLIALLGLLAMVVYALRQLPYRDAQLQILGKRDVPQLALGKRVVAASDLPSGDEPWPTGLVLASRADEPEEASKGEETAPGAGATSKDSDTPAGSATNSPGPTAGGPTDTKATGGGATTAPPAVTTSPGSNGGDGGTTATSSPKHGDPKMKDPSDHGSVDTPMTRTESPDDTTDLPDDSDDGPTSFTVAPSKATDDYGNVGTTRTITQDPGKTTVSPEEPGTTTPPPVVSTGEYTIPPSNHGQVGETITQDDDVTSTKATTDFGHVDETVTQGDPHPTRPPSNHGPVGTTISSVTQSPSDFGPVDKTVTGDGSTGIVTVNPSDYGPVETVVVVPGKDKEQGDDDDDDKPTKTQPLPPAYVTAAPTTLTNSKGEATATSTATPAPVSTPKTVVYADSKGQPTSTQVTNVEAKPTTLIETNAKGVETTVVRYPSSVPVSTSSETSTLTDDQGKPTKTELRKFLVTPSVTVETDSDGVPTATETSYNAVPSEYAGDSNTVETLSYISWGEYFVGMFLPTLLAMILGWPIRILDQNARSFQPFHELTRPGGVTGARSVCLETGGWGGIYSTARWVVKGQVTVIASTVLVLASALLVPLSAEAISLDLRGDCVRGSGNAQGCQYVLSTRSQAIHATISLLAVMALAVLVLMAYAARWQTGVRTNPWSICGIAALSLNDEVRKLFTSLPAGIDASKIPLKLLGSVLGHRRFTLGYYYNATGTLEYGFMLQEDGAAEASSEERTPEMRPSQTTRSEGDSLLGQQRDHEGAHMQTKHNLPFLMLGYLGRGTLVAVLVGLLVLILYYNNTGGESAFEDFMSSESFGLRFLFTGVGIIITYFWASFFNSIAVMSPYLLLSQTPHVARRSILLSPPTNAFSGLWSAIRRRHAFLAVVAATSILSEFLPIFLAEVPFRVSQAYIVHLVCTWSATGILFVMLAVVLGSFFVTWPHMPLDPSTVAGAMYYVCDSALLGHLEGGASLLGRAERDQRVNAMGLRYRFGEMRGASNCKKRIGVDVSDDRLQSA